LNTLILWFAHHRVAANLLMLLLAAGGLFTLPELDRQIYPPISLERVKILASWPGASPSEIETALCIVIEDAIYNVDGIDSIESRATEGQCSVEVNSAKGVDTLLLKDRLQQKIDAISSFPEDVDSISLEKVINKNDTVDIALYGKLDKHSLHNLADQIYADLLTLPEIAQIEMYGAPEYELAIHVSKMALSRYKLTFDDVVTAIRAAETDTPGGTLDTNAGKFLLRIRSDATWASGYENILLRTGKDGNHIRLEDVATVVDGFSEKPIIARFDGKPAIFFSIYAGGHVEESSQAIQSYVNTRKATLPAKVQITTWLDDSGLFDARFEMLRKNIITALLTVLLVLFLFLQMQLAFWVFIGLAVTFLGSLAGMWLMGLPLSMMTMFTFLFILGIAVDDAIIIAESVHSEWLAGRSGIGAAVKGTRRVAWPVIIAVMTTMVAFLPGLFLPGGVGEISRPLPLMVIIILSLSLVESLFILPAHLRGYSAPDPSKPFRLSRIQEWFSRGLEGFINNIYTPFVHKALEYRLITLFSFISLMLIVIAIVAGGWVRLVVMPEVDSDRIKVNISLPHGSPFEQVNSAVEAVEKILHSHLLTAQTVQPDDAFFTHVQTTVENNEGQLIAEIDPATSEKTPVRTLVALLRKQIGSLPPEVSMEFSYTIWQASNQLKLQVSASNLDVLREGSQDLKQILATYQGVYNIKDSYEQGKTEIEISLKPEAAYLDITVDDLARQVRQGYQGTVIRQFSKGHKQGNVVIRYLPEDRQSIQALQNILVKLPNGRRVPLSTIAVLNYQSGFVTIDRVNRRRSMVVSADTDPSIADPRKIIADLHRGKIDQLETEHVGLKIELGKGPQQEEAWLSTLKFNGFLALIGIYILLSLFFQSYLQPVLVMIAIPFGIIGAIMGHLLLDIDLTMNSLIGMVAASGVVVNDSLVLIDRINTGKKTRQNLKDKVSAAAKARFRPIVLTSLTTFVGLAPLMLESSIQAQYIIPMAVSLAFGVLFATLITLILLPVCYSLLSSIEEYFQS
jgi:multidrug efflux pump subunit AcrB